MSDVAEAPVFEVNSKVKFVGFADGGGIPENGEHLKVGEVYTIDKIEEGEDDIAYTLLVESPDFDPDKRAHKTKNPRYLKVETFADELEAAPARKTRRKKATAEEVTEEQATEAPAEAPAKKATTAKKTTAKKSTTKAKAEEKTEEKKEENQLPAHLKGVRDFEVIDEAIEDQDIVELVRETEDICQLAKELAQESASAEFRLGGILYHVRKDGSYIALDPETYSAREGFARYCEQELGLSYRKAMYLAKTYASFCKVGLTSDQFASIGWSKAKELASVVTEENKDQLIEMAQNSTVVDLIDNIKESYSSVSGTQQREVVKKVTFKFRLVEEAAASIKHFLETAKDSTGLDSLDAVFEHIVQEWAQEHLEVSKTRARRKAS